MSPGARMEHLEAIVIRYRNASKQQKSIILDEFCATCGYNRKYAISLLCRFRRFFKKKSKKRGKPSRYNTPALIEALRNIWLAAHLPCSKRLKAILPNWLRFYHNEYGHLPHSISELLLTISAPTIDRILKPIKRRYITRGRCTTKPGSLLKKHIAIKTDQWNESRPGFLEADSVALCGANLRGEFVYILDFTDLATTWTEHRAIWGKGEIEVVEQTKDVETLLPFALLGFDSDNGPEFLNWHLFRHFSERTSKVQFTRSRPYQKNDNAHVEEKNWTKVRQWFGYQRFDNPAVVPLLNELLRGPWRLYHNFFIPSVKLVEKFQVAGKTVKRYDIPQTPFQRVLESKFVTQEIKRKLKEQFHTLNPFDLKRTIDAQLKKIFSIATLTT